ncbi:DNA-directed RNA polymerase I subunit RPA49 [Megalobrama amblycephala]|uniref:DNA-directed RNA polymerase I subunit RPA49 n=1 Tax=Megalobrama amblycephala TaxID=75352 RepID=UPI0020147D37|nr:DNA-directed RNA polymerase I subunit RPA49 [Megalobrama amblycephala]XP_048053510.1 DNA-directed RNA polymerase I subunit RPA49 [Megalobrama amblycephala]
MAAACEWKSCEETETDAYIVKFSNGVVKDAEHLDFKLFKHEDGLNPRKKNRRIVVAESDRLPYVGNNFGPGSLQCNNLCRYFVGVLDKSTMQMKVHNAQLFNMLPTIPGESAADDNKKQAETYREKVDALIEAFGTTKQKRALTSRRLNEVGNEMLHRSVAQAASNIIDRKGVEALRNEVVEAQAETTLFLPTCNTDADKAEDVYPFDCLLSAKEFNALKDVGMKFATLTPENLQEMRAEFCPQTVIRHLESLPNEAAARDRQSRCAWYLSFLIKVSRRKWLPPKFATESGCPKIIFDKVRKNFTVESFHNGLIKNTVSMSMRMKLASHCLALLLHMNNQTADLTLLHRDLSITENKMLELAKAMGLTLSRLTVIKDEGIKDEHRMASVVLPLVFCDRRVERRKRKRMN